MSTGDPRYMRTFYLQFRVYAIEIMAVLRSVSSYLPMLLALLYADSLNANHYFRSLSIAYNEVHLYCILLLYFLDYFSFKCTVWKKFLKKSYSLFSFNFFTLQIKKQICSELLKKVYQILKWEIVNTIKLNSNS